MAFSTVWLTLASIIAMYDITKAIDGSGNVIEPYHECVSAFTKWFRGANPNYA
jgi:hypothetical protein